MMRPNRHRLIAAMAIAGLLVVSSAGAATVAPDDGEASFRALYKELVETNTTLSSGSCTEAAQAMAARLQAAGMAQDSTQVLAPADRPKSGALVAVMAGSDPRLEPIMLLAHIDVVEAKREDWERDPFTLVEEDGYFYARGASDDKAMAAVWVDTLIRFQREGFKPSAGSSWRSRAARKRLATFNSVDWLLRTRPDVLKAKFVLNEGAGGLLGADGRHLALDVQAGEKVYQDFALETTNPGGHSARPVRDNAINQLAAGLTRLAGYQFPITWNQTTRAYFEAQAGMASPEVARDIRAVLANPQDVAASDRLWTANPEWNGTMRTTCVATQIEGGHAPNALPQRAQANVNCRILPGVPIETVQDDLRRIVADDGIRIRPTGNRGLVAPVPALSPQIMEPIKKVAAGLWPGVPIIPTMSPGATDGRFLNAAGIPTYGLSGMFHDATGSRAHGLNERIRVKSLLDGRRFLYEVVRLYAQQPD